MKGRNASPALLIALVAVPLLVVIVVITSVGRNGPTAHAVTTWNIGDVFAGIAGGQYSVFDNNGVFKETISDGLGGFTTGCAFNPALDKLYTTNFTNTKVVVYNNASPHTIAQTVDTAVTSPGGHTESVVFAADGEFYVGHPDGNDLIHHYTAAGTLSATFAAAVNDRGTDWLDLAADQKTLYYTGEGRLIQRFDTDAPSHAAPSQLAAFTTLPGTGIAFALRLLPPGDGSGGLLVADNTNIKRLNGAGAVTQTYDATGEDGWFSLNLDPNGTSFWAGDQFSNNFYRFNITTGAIEVGPIASGGPLFGLCLKGELTAATPPPDEQININVVDKRSGAKLEGTCWRISYGPAKVVHDVVGDDSGGVKPDCGEPSNLKLFDKDPSPGNVRITITSDQRVQFGDIWHAQMSFEPNGNLDTFNYECDLALGKCEIGPVAVGGLAVDLDGDLGELPAETAQSSGSNAGVLGGTIAGISAAIVAFGGAAWYARRRWVN